MALDEELSLLPKKTCLKITGHSNSTFYAAIRAGDIPPGVLIGLRSRRWPSTEIRAYVQRCIAKRDSQLDHRPAAS